MVFLTCVEAGLKSGIQCLSVIEQDATLPPPDAEALSCAEEFADIDLSAFIRLDARRTIELSELRKNLLPAEASDDARPSLGA